MLNRVLHAARQMPSWLIFDVRQNMRSWVLIVLLICGCVQFPLSRIGETDLIGSYSNGDGFWPRSLELRADRTFSYHQLTDVIAQQKDGSMVFEGSWGVIGRWTFLPPDRIEMLPDGKPGRIEVFVRMHRGDQVAILEPDLFPDILKTWKPDGSLRYLKKQKPNKAPEPTTGPVTSRADGITEMVASRKARLAPGPVVAHL